MSHKIIKIDTESDWHKGRSKGIGGSDAAAIIGQNPYKTNLELWREKTGREKPKDVSSKPAVMYGKKAEEYLRQLFMLDYPEYEMIYRPYDLHVHNEHEFIRASLDGELINISTKEKGIWECKTTEIKQRKDWEKWNNKIPQNYYCQILHYFAVDEDYKFAKLKAQIKDTTGDEIILTTKHYHLTREECKTDIEYLMNEEIKFWWYVENDKEPPLKLPEI